MVRVWAFLLSWGAVPVILYGAAFLGAAGVEAYMIAFGWAKPGDEVFPGFPATPLKVSLIEVLERGVGALPYLQAVATISHVHMGRGEAAR